LSSAKSADKSDTAYTTAKYTMFDFLFDTISKPFIGLVILVKLFVTGDPASKDPSIESLVFVNTADSVFVQAVIRNGLTEEIKDLIEGGVVVKTTCTFSCGACSRHWERKLQYNPIKRTGCYLSPDGASDRIFKGESLSVYFNRIEFYLSDLESVKKMQSASAKIKIATSINVEAMEIGEKKLWPKGIEAAFAVPALTPQLHP
jgi:hypothetical protein